jgi:hypothetical protein
VNSELKVDTREQSRSGLATEKMLTAAMMTDREEDKSCRQFWRRGEARGVLVKRKVMAEMMARSIWREEQRGQRIWWWHEVTTAADRGGKEEDDGRLCAF